MELSLESASDLFCTRATRRIARMRFVKCKKGWRLFWTYSIPSRTVSSLSSSSEAECLAARDISATGWMVEPFPLPPAPHESGLLAFTRKSLGYNNSHGITRMKTARSSNCENGRTDGSFQFRLQPRLQRKAPPLRPAPNRSMSPDVCRKASSCKRVCLSGVGFGDSSYEYPSALPLERERPSAFQRCPLRPI